MNQSPFGTPAPAAVPPHVQPEEDAVAGNRRRLLLLGGAGLAGLVVAGGLALVLLTGGDAPADESAALPLPAASAAPDQAPVEEPVELPTDVQFNDRNPFQADVLQSSGGAASTTGSADSPADSPADSTADSAADSGEATSGTTGGAAAADSTATPTTTTAPVDGATLTGGTTTGEAGPPGPQGPRGAHGHLGRPGDDGRHGKNGTDGEDAVLPAAVTFLGYDGANRARARFALDYGTAEEVLVSVAAGKQLEDDVALPGSDITYLGPSASDAANVRVRVADASTATYTLAPGRPRLLPRG